MTGKISAGILVFRRVPGSIQFLLVHPGGPYWNDRDIGAWSIPKGLAEPDDDSLLRVALREFSEETGIDVTEISPDVLMTLFDIGQVTQKSGKVVYAWAMELNVPTETMDSNLFDMEYPKGSGITRKFPEVDKHEYFDEKTAKEKINPAQIPFIDRIISKTKNI